MANFNDFDLDLQTQKVKKDIKGQEVKSPNPTLRSCAYTCTCHSGSSYI